MIGNTNSRIAHLSGCLYSETLLVGGDRIAQESCEQAEHGWICANVKDDEATPSLMRVEG